MTATLVAPTTLTTMPDLTSKAAADRAVNQLISVIVGRDLAKLTDSLKTDPKGRVQKCIELTLAEYQMTVMSRDDKAVKQLQRKVDSLTSLATLANLITEVEWDD